MKAQFHGTVTAFEQQIVENVDRHGCHINWVFDAEVPEPPFAYSVGFTKTLGAPEVILFGLPQETCGPAINALLQMCAAGMTLEEGQVIPEFFGEYDCTVRMVHESWLTEEYFASALWYHRTQMGQALRHVAMIVWPDEHHRFPWDGGCADWVRADQPALYNSKVSL